MANLARGMSLGVATVALAVIMHRRVHEFRSTI